MTDEPVELTVVIPHYNHAGLLPRSIASALDQGIERLEVIVVDDGSGTDCDALLSHLETADPRIRVIRHGVNRGAPAALNTGLAAARGIFTTFLGADDLVLPGLYRPLIDALGRNTAASFACGEIAIVGDDGRIRGMRPMTAPGFREEFLPPVEVQKRIRKTDNWICNTATLYRTKSLRRIGGFEEELGAFCDGFLVRQLAFETGFVFVPNKLGVWRVAADTLSARSVLERGESERLVRVAEDRLTNSNVGETSPFYPPLYARRLRFAAARMHFVWHKEAADPAAIAATAGLEGPESSTLQGIRNVLGFGRYGRAAALGFLALRLRPFAPLPLVANMIRNRLMLMRNTARITAGIAHAEKLAERLTPGGEAA